eukprot:m.229466 g.229466  ORF g.229466 m.229466 type:complete len:98 (+) comp17750_c0_seq1:35-328(+)
MSLLLRQALRVPQRLMATAAETRMAEKLKTELEAERVEVEDQSGGCGAQYAVFVVSNKFRGLNLVQQQRLVNKILKDEFKDLHSLRVFTKVPDTDKQ